MIAGIGTDIVEVSRVAEKIGRTSGFREAVFSPEEIAWCEPKKNSAQHYAARFAAKEALLKATGEGLTSAAALHEISVARDAKGKPFFTFAGAAARHFGERGFVKIHLSLSHVRETAVAVVVIEV